jgi:hypothetical protein
LIFVSYPPSDEVPPEGAFEVMSFTPRGDIWIATNMPQDRNVTGINRPKGKVTRGNAWADTREDFERLHSAAVGEHLQVLRKLGVKPSQRMKWKKSRSKGRGRPPFEWSDLTPP